MWSYNHTDELYHHGIKGQKWGVRRYQNEDGTLTSAGKKRQHRSTSLGAAIAKRANNKVDKGFNDWKENAAKKDNAVALGKQANLSRMAYEADKHNKDAKQTYKSDRKEYKSALRANTTYRKGAIKGEVGKDIARKYLIEAKRVKKILDADPTNKQLQKQYNALMSKHDIERAKARRAPEVAANRSRKIASLKAARTKAIKGAALTAAATAGAAGITYLIRKNSTEFSDIKINSDTVLNAMKFAKNVTKFI